MSLGMRQSTFVRLVAEGMARAYRVAEQINSESTNNQVRTYVDFDASRANLRLIDRGDPKHLPRIHLRARRLAVGNTQRAECSLGATRAEMYRILRDLATQVGG